jgi:hypothetical protein
MADNKEKDTKTTTDTTAQDVLMARLAEIENNLKGTIERQNEVIENQNKTIEELKNRPTQSVDHTDEAILIDRQSAHTMRLPVVDGAPVIAGKLERVIGVPGLEYIMNVTTADNKKHSFPFGCDVNKLDFSNEKLKDIRPTSYETIRTENFKLQDVDTNDLTGASKVEKGKIVSEGNVIPEVDRSSGRPVMTGRKIRTVVRADVRHYTIEYGGKKFTISSNDLGNFRI